MNNKKYKFFLVSLLSIFFFFSLFQTSHAGFFDWFKWFSWPKKIDSQKTVEIIPIVKKSESSSSQKNSDSNKPSSYSSKISSSKSLLNKTSSTSATKSQITVKQSGGSAMLTQECSVKSYLIEKADYIIDGVMGSSESKWNEQKTSIFTYTNLVIQKYVKGMPFEKNEIKIVTPGGEVGGIGQSVGDQLIFHQGKKVRIYFQKTNGEFSIVCAQAGVEEI